MLAGELRDLAARMAEVAAKEFSKLRWGIEPTRVIAYAQGYSDTDYKSKRVHLIGEAYLEPFNDEPQGDTIIQVMVTNQKYGRVRIGTQLVSGEYPCTLNVRSEDGVLIVVGYRFSRQKWGEPFDPTRSTA